MIMMKGLFMAEKYDAPWFDALSPVDRQAYVDNATQLMIDLHTAASFIGVLGNMKGFPVRSYQPEVDLQYFVQESDADPRGTFEALAKNIVAAGGSTFDRSDADNGSVQHVAELRFGSGRVAYRAVWIERTPTDAV